MDNSNFLRILTPKNVQMALGLSDNQINQIYRFFNCKGFPSERIGSKHIISRVKFLDWLGERV